MTMSTHPEVRFTVPRIPAWLHYEMRYLGWLSFTLPCLVLLLVAGIAGATALAGATLEHVGRLLVAGLEMGLPYAAGIGTAAIITCDPAVVLQLSTPTGVRWTIGRRVGLLTGWPAFLAITATLVLRGLGLWQVWAPNGLWQSQLVWLAPLAWFTGAGLILGLVFGSQTTSSALLSGLWVFMAILASVVLDIPGIRLEFLFLTSFAPDAGFWLANRAVVLASGIGMIALAIGLSTTPGLHTRGEAA